MGLATQLMRFLRAEQGHHRLATVELGRDSVMDFEAQQERRGEVKDEDKGMEV